MPQCYVRSTLPVLLFKNSVLCFVAYEQLSNTCWHLPLPTFFTILFSYQTPAISLAPFPVTLCLNETLYPFQKKRLMSLFCSRSLDVPLHSIKACGRVELQLHSFLASALGDASGQPYILAALTPGKCPWFPMNRRPCRPQSPYRRFRERNSLSCWELHTHFSVIQPVAWFVHLTKRSPGKCGYIVEEDIQHFCV